jgi:hypothetical protein
MNPLDKKSCVAGRGSMPTKGVSEYPLYGVAGWGSALVEAALVRANAPFAYEDVSGFDHPGEARERLQQINPLAQVPALILPSDETMTESAAIILHLSEVYPIPAWHPKLAPRWAGQHSCGGCYGWRPMSTRHPCLQTRTLGTNRARRFASGSVHPS